MDKCPKCKKDTVIELSNKDVLGGVLLCTSCWSNSPFARSTLAAYHSWEWWCQAADDAKKLEVGNG